MFSSLMAQQSQMAMQQAIQAQQARLMGSLTPPVLSSELFPQCAFPNFPNPMPQECPEIKIGAQAPMQSVAPVIGQHGAVAAALKFHKKNVEAASSRQCFLTI